MGPGYFVVARLGIRFGASGEGGFYWDREPGYRHPILLRFALPKLQV
jgi:hypothetical protein